MDKKTEIAKIYDLLYKRFVSKRDENYMLSHIAHINGFLYASNGHILAKVRVDYPKEREGMAFSETGSSEKSTINYEKTIPKKRDGDIYLSDEEVKNLKVASKNVWRTKIDGKKVVINIGLQKVYYDYQDCYMTFRAEYLYSAFRLFDIRKEFPIIQISASKVMALESETITVLIMPVMACIEDDDPFFTALTVQEAINFKNKPKNIRDLAWYER